MTYLLLCIQYQTQIKMELILIPLASTQHNLYDIYQLLCIQYQTQIKMELILIPLAST
jgi:hypothetical protein